MWAGLSTWIVQDGQLPEIAVGSLLHGLGVSVTGAAIASASDVGAAIDLQGPVGPEDEFGPYPYLLIGAAGTTYELSLAVPWLAPRIDTEFVLTCGPVQFKATVTDTRSTQIRPGHSVTLRGALNVMAEHEFEFGDESLVHVARSWVVKAIQVQQYEVLWTPILRPGTEPGWSGTPGRRLNLTNIDHIDAWPDATRFAAAQPQHQNPTTDFYYLLDLHPHQ